MKTCLSAVVSLALMACASSSPRIDPARLGELQAGQTTVAEIVRQFGRPGILSKNPDGTQWAIYVHKDGQTGTTVIPLVATDPVDSITFYFDTSGVLTHYKSTQANTNKRAPAEAAQTTTPVSSAQAASAGSPVVPQTESGRTVQAGNDKTTSGNVNTFKLPDWLPSSTVGNR